jgi:poly-gamma-glutamate synthesis protein (capsule biosynthesis protein)
MPLHDDEMKKRREKREAQRKKQQAEARRLRLALIGAAMILVLCGIGIFRLTRGLERPMKEETPVIRETEAPVEETVKTVPVEEPITTIHIRAAGDLNVTKSVVESGLSANGFDFNRAFKDVAAILSEADLTVMNMEGNFCGEPYGTETTSAPTELLRDLRGAGVDLLQVANSCIINNGMIGMTSTLNAIRSAGIEPVGAYANEAELRQSKGYTITDVRGVKVAFVAFTKGLGGRGMPAGNENLVNLLYEDYATTYRKEDKDRITTILKNVETEKPDITIALVHWGSEYNDAHSATQESIKNLLFANGVNAIIGTHPHYVQKMELNDDGTFIAYSLGDFISDADRAGTEYSVVLDLEITRNNMTGETKVTGYSYTPIFTAADDKGILRVLRLREGIAAYDAGHVNRVTKAVYDQMIYAHQRVDKRAKGE